FRYRKAGFEGSALRERAADWAESHGEALAVAEPAIPPELTDRAADCWEPLIAIADIAGGAWPDRARAAARILNAARLDRDPSLGVRLLADVRSAFGDADRIFTEELLARLVGMDESPWGDMYGRALDARGLAKRLRPYDVAPKQLRIGDRSAKGYERSAFHDAWDRYLPGEPETRVTSETLQVSDVPVTSTVSAVAPVSPLSEDEEERYGRDCPELFEVSDAP
ncbi:MAG: DUF3631 domain-containing protein, partial [Acidimicrobiia bacterium]|nr:DUF3631 domain-containing protein [Acidimicrobiia bacterium]